MRRFAIPALVLALIAFACARPRPRADAIEFWQPWPPSVVAPLVARFEAENPSQHVHVRQVPLAVVSDSLAAALAAGSPPDLCVLGPSEMPRWLASGALSDWSAGVADLRDSLRGWPMCTVGDALYGLPWLLNARVLIANPALCARAHVDPVRGLATWTQLRTAAARLQKLGGVHGFGIARGDSLAAAAEFLSFAWGGGGELLSARLDSARFDSPEVLAALEFYRSLRATALIASPETLRSEFEAGRLGLWVGDGSVYARPGRRGQAPPYWLALVPRPDSSRGAGAAYADGLVLVSLTQSKHKEHALRLARSLARPERVLDLAATVDGLQPATAAADSAWALRAPAALRNLTRQCATARFAPAVAHWDSMCTTIASAVDDALQGRTPAAAALADAAARVTRLAARR